MGLDQIKTQKKKVLDLIFISAKPFSFCKFSNVYKTCIRNAWTMLILCLAGVSPIVSEHRKQIDDLKKFKNDFRVSFSLLMVSSFSCASRLF